MTNTIEMSLYLFLFLLLCTHSALVRASTILDMNPVTFNYTAPYLSNTTLVTSTFSISLLNLTVDPCLIQHPRSEVCIATLTQYGGTVITTTPCETNNISDCLYAPRVVEKCRYINATTACTNAW